MNFKDFKLTIIVTLMLCCVIPIIFICSSKKDTYYDNNIIETENNEFYSSAGNNFAILENETQDGFSLGRMHVQFNGGTFERKVDELYTGERWINYGEIILYFIVNDLDKDKVQELENVAFCTGWCGGADVTEEDIGDHRITEGCIEILDDDEIAVHLNVDNHEMYSNDYDIVLGSVLIVGKDVITSKVELKGTLN